MAMTRSLWFALIAMACMSSVGHAQNWPSRPVRAIVPVSAGSGIDIVGRVTSQRLAQALGQPVVVENRPGAGTTIGAAVVAKAAGLVPQ